MAQKKPEAGPQPSTAGSPPHSLDPLATSLQKKKTCSSGSRQFLSPKEPKDCLLPLLQMQKTSIDAKEICPWCARSSPATSSRVGNRPGSRQLAPSKGEHPENQVNSPCGPTWLPGTRMDTRHSDGCSMRTPCYHSLIVLVPVLTRTNVIRNAQGVRGRTRS